MYETDDPSAEPPPPGPRRTSPEAGDSPLGPRPEMGNFEAIRADLRARILDVDITNIDTSPAYCIRGESPASTPKRVGRYSILALLGRGGMGIVHLAYDHSLDRKLAIKLLDKAPRNASPEHGTRLRLEARAMARISHPNTVTIHEVGEYEGQLYIAMEYVKGLCLRQWLDTHTRSWRQILQVFLQAGEGLAAAHAAGVIHRDFKPANILVGEDGRVRVADFGLAWTYRMTMADNERTEQILPTDSESSAESNADDLIAHRTKTGTVLGTLAFMAPEQYRGETPTISADVFSYCVALYQALYGHLPFDATSATIYRQLVHSGTIRPANPTAMVPLWLRNILLRGLDPQPEKRWRSLPELLAALRHRQRVRLPQLAIAFAFTGLAALATLAALPGSEAPPVEPCSAEDALTTVWSPSARDPLRTRYLAQGGATNRARAWRTIDAALTLYSDRWAIEYTRSCQLRRSFDPEIAAVAERVSTCLKDHKMRLTELIVQLDSAAMPDIETAVLAATGLPSPELCRQAPPSSTLLTSKAALAGLPRIHLLAARRQLARANVDIELHRLSAAQSTLKGVISVARERSAISLEAESLLALSRAERASHEIQAARTSLERARELVRDNPEERALELRILIQLVDIVGVGLGDLAGAQALAREATALNFALGDPPLLAAYLANNLARAHRAHHHLDEANSGYLKAYTLLQQTLGESAPETIAARANLGVAQSLLQKPEAIAILELTLEQQLSTIGEFHPRTPSIMRNLGNALGREGQFERATLILQRAVKLRQQLLGDPSPELAGDLLSLARAQRGQHQLAKAEKNLSRAAGMIDIAGPKIQSSIRHEERALERALERAGDAAPAKAVLTKAAATEAPTQPAPDRDDADRTSAY